MRFDVETTVIQWIRSSGNYLQCFFMTEINAAAAAELPFTSKSNANTPSTMKMSLKIVSDKMRMEMQRKQERKSG